MDNNGESNLLQGKEITELEDFPKSTDLENEGSSRQLIEEIIVKMELAHENQCLLQRIENAQQKLSVYMAKSPEKDFFDHVKESDDVDEKYFLDLLETVINKTETLKNNSEQCSNEIIVLKNEIEEQEKSLAETDALFKESIKKTALNSVHSESGENFTTQEVDDLLMKEEKVLKALREFQIYSIQKRYSLDVVNKQKTNLSEGPLDFAKYEMMCIEIQNNKEIIQTVSEEIKNITKKASSIISVLSHLEQKLYLAQEEKNKASHKEKLLEKELIEMRDELLVERMKYDKMKHENKELQHKFILLQHPPLIDDYNKVKQENENAVTETENLKNTYEQVMKLTKG